MEFVLAYVGEALGAEIAGTAVGGMVGAALGGGLGAEIGGGDFWSGALASGLGNALGGSFGDSIGSGLASLGLDAGLTGNVISGLTGATQAALSGGNILQGALVGGVMPNVMSGAKNVMSSWGGGGSSGGLDSGKVTGWGGASPSMDATSPQSTWGSVSSSPDSASLWGDVSPTYDAGMSGGSLMPNNGAQSLMNPANTGIGGGTSLVPNNGYASKVNPGGSPAPTASQPNFLQSLIGGNDGKLLPTLVNAGTNLYMNTQNQKMAEKMAAMADPYQQYRAGDAASYQALLKDPNSVFSDPSYIAMAKQGDEALMRQAAAMGKIDSGQLTAKLSEQRMALADQFYRNRLAQYSGGAGVANSGAAAQAYGNTRTNNYLAGAINAPSMVMSQF